MKNSIIIIIVMLLLAFVSACTEIFETNIKDKEITLIAPTDSLETCGNLHTFIWDEIEGAHSYNLRIVSPSFNSLESIVLDTILGITQFSYSLEPGDYQWGVKAINDNYETKFFIRNIHIDTTYDFSLLQVLLNSPTNNFATNLESVNFSWNGLSGAETYYYEVREDDWDSGSVFVSGSTTETELDLSLDEGVYYWGISAHDDFSGTSSPYSTRKIVIDQTVPINSTTTYPVNNDTIQTADLISGQIIFSWTRASDSGSELSDSIYVFSDLELTSLVFRAKSNSTSYYFTPTQFGEYYWFIKTFDAAGNIAEFNVSQIRKFRYEE
ncbi:MAG: hypothetical protein PHE56_00605 [Bacteroidales bacterium]|nr:hypothetical protein [Bacteroidales bacterium]